LDYDQAYCPLCQLSVNSRGSIRCLLFNCGICVFYETLGDKCLNLGYSYYMTKDEITAFNKIIQSIPED
jgi:hypothetical protein